MADILEEKRAFGRGGAKNTHRKVLNVIKIVSRVVGGVKFVWGRISGGCLVKDKVEK